MGNKKVTILENRTWFNIEVKMWVDGSRPDRFRKIVRIKPGRSTRVKASTFNSDDDPDVSSCWFMQMEAGQENTFFLRTCSLMRLSSAIGTNTRSSRSSSQESKLQPLPTQPMEIYVDDEAKLTLHGLVQHYIKLSELKKNRKLMRWTLTKLSYLSKA